MDLNKAMIIGRLTRDPEMRTTPTGANVVSFALATNFVWTDQSGQKKEQVEFHNIVAWRKLAETISKYLKKGSRVYIEGRLQTRSWDGQDGKKNYRTEIVADSMIMLDSKGRSDSQEPMAAERPAANEAAPAEELPTIQISNEDIPF
jgi:single-strand DNA-binding protein